MKTLLEAAIEHERTLSPCPAEDWDATRGHPFVMSYARPTFMAGAAAMAEQFVNGVWPALAPKLVELAAISADRAHTSCWIEGPPTAPGWYVLEYKKGQPYMARFQVIDLYPGKIDKMDPTSILRHFGFREP